MKYKDKKQKKNSLVVCLSELILVKKSFDELKAINRIHRHIKKSSQKPLIDKILKRILEIKFESNNSVKSNALKYAVNKILPSF